jgi:hypothetical protein
MIFQIGVGKYTPLAIILASRALRIFRLGCVDRALISWIPLIHYH